MALEDLTGTKYIDSLNSSNPVGATDPKSEGDDHLRGIKNVLKTTFPNIDGAVTATPTELNLLDGQEGGFLLKANSTGGGTADAITADFTPNVSLTDGVTVIVRAQGANTVTNPTFNPDGLGAKTIVKYSNTALLVGDIAGSSHELILKYNSTNDNWSLLNPSVEVYGTFASNSNGNPNLDDTTFAVNSEVTHITWESVGPTGSGATNTWAGLDNIPSGVDWIEVKIQNNGVSSADTANAERESQVYVRKTGSSQLSGIDNKISMVFTEIDGAGNGNAGNMSVGVKIPVDGSIRFDCYWQSDFNSTTSIHMVVTGYGYNP